MIDEAWLALAGDHSQPAFTVHGRPGSLPSALPVEDVAVASVGLALLAAAALHETRGAARAAVAVDREHVAAAVRSERFFEVDGARSGPGFAPLSAFWRAADGWLRTHANFPWHRSALLDALDLPDEAGPDTIAAAIAGRPAAEVEFDIFERGGVAARVRTAEQWWTSPQGRATSAEPLVGCAHVPGAAARDRDVGALPASGVRVLDLTRVIAGPVGTRMLGALGADVLRIDLPGRPDLRPGAHGDTLLGKRSAALDLDVAGDRDRLHNLLDGADVLVCGYRPGALDRFGLGEDELSRQHPGLVTVRIAAWGHTGPWAARRGFDSVVQAAVGIADAESGDRTSAGSAAIDGVAAPGALPCQLLDHGTGYLVAAAALDSLRRQGTDGGTITRTVSLARTARWLLDASATRSGQPQHHEPRAEAAPEPWMTALPGGVRAVRPPGRIGDVELSWPTPPTRYLADEPHWCAAPRTSSPGEVLESPPTSP